MLKPGVNHSSVYLLLQKCYNFAAALALKTARKLKKSSETYLMNMNM